MLEKSAANTGKFSAAEHTTHAAATFFAAAKLLHHLLCLLELFDKTVHRCNIHTGTFCNTVFSLRGQDLGIPAFLFCYG